MVIQKGGIIYAPLYDERKPALFFAFQEAFKLQPKEARRTVEAQSIILENYISEVTSHFRAVVPKSLISSKLDNHQIRIWGLVGLDLMYAVDKSIRVSVEIGTLVYLLSRWAGSPTTIKCFEKLRKTFTVCQNVAAYSPSNGWRGAYAESRLWKTIATKEFQRSVRNPLPCVIRGWYSKAITADIHIIEKLLNIIMNELEWRGCPDLVLWKKKHLVFVEVKSSTDTMSQDQKIFKATVLNAFPSESAQIQYRIALTKGGQTGGYSKTVINNENEKLSPNCKRRRVS